MPMAIRPDGMATGYVGFKARPRPRNRTAGGLGCLLSQPEASKGLGAEAESSGNRHMQRAGTAREIRGQMERKGLGQALLCSTFGLLCAWPAAARDGTVWQRPVLNFNGVPGLVDMPGAHQMPDAEGSITVNAFGEDVQRNIFHFQIGPRVSGVFRYVYGDDLRNTGAYYDRSFDLRYQILEEGLVRPALTVGLQDFGGTGIYAGEYVVAGKTFGRLRATAGIGWGRFGSENGFDNPFGIFGDRFDTRPDNLDLSLDETGQFDADQWFRGDAAFFGGLQYAVSDQLILSAEYSSDAYELEEANTGFTRQSPVSVAASYRFDSGLDLTAAWLYGDTLGVQLTYSFNPKTPPGPDGGREGQGPVVATQAAAALGWGGMLGGAGGQDGTAGSLEAQARARLAAQGLALIALQRDGDALEVHFRNDRYLAEAEAIGRAARAMAGLLPPGTDRMILVPRRGELAPTAVTLERSDLAALQTDLEGSWKSFARAGLGDGRDHPLSLATPGAYPRLTYGADLYLGPTVSDPDNFTAEGGLRFDAGLALAPGLSLDAELRQPLAVNRVEPLPNLPGEDRDYPVVRTDAPRYDDDTDLELRRLTLDYVFRPGQDLFGRVSAGQFEQMYGGVSGELLWKPADSRLGLGAELTYARKRSPDDPFAFEDYDTTTGFVSAYYEFDGGYLGQVDVGQYLAGDTGATISLDREFDNGFSIGAFATLTDMDNEDFGEGSFDKGIRFSVPASWLLGYPSRREFATTWRPTTGDGGARVKQANRLYERVRQGQARELQEDWGSFWR